MKLITLLTLLFMVVSVSAQLNTHHDNYPTNTYKLMSEVSTSATNANFYNEKGLMKEQEGDLESALEFYSKAVNMASNTTAFLFNKARQHRF